MRLNILLQILKLLLNIFLFKWKQWQAGDNLVRHIYHLEPFAKMLKKKKIKLES